MTQLARDSNGTSIQAIRPGTSQNVAVGAASAQSAAMAEGTTIARIVSNTGCRYAIGANAVAAATSTYLPAGVVEFVSVTRGDKIAFIQDITGGNANVTEGA